MTTSLQEILQEAEKKVGHLTPELQAKLRVAIENALQPDSPMDGSAGITGPPDRLVSMRDLPTITGYSRRKILDMVSKGEFPQPIRLNSRTNRWRLSAVMQWIDELEAKSSGNPVPRVCNNPVQA